MYLEIETLTYFENKTMEKKHKNVEKIPIKMFAGQTEKDNFLISMNLILYRWEFFWENGN